MEHIENHLIYVIFTRKKIKVSLPCVLYPKFHVLWVRLNWGCSFLKRRWQITHTHTHTWYSRKSKRNEWRQIHWATLFTCSLHTG